jgi:hypothetical protein
MFQWLKKFFAVDNEVNEDTVMGVLSFAATIVAVFVRTGMETVYILGGMTLAFFGLGGLKKPGN